MLPTLCREAALCGQFGGIVAALGVVVDLRGAHSVDKGMLQRSRSTQLKRNNKKTKND